jgi:hypothetical protein
MELSFYGFRFFDECADLMNDSSQKSTPNLKNRRVPLEIAVGFRFWRRFFLLATELGMKLPKK